MKLLFKHEGKAELRFLQRHLVLEGHEVVSASADFQIGGTESDLPAMLWGTHIGPASLQTIGIPTSLGSSDYYLTRLWARNRWGDRTFCGTPVRGTGDEGKGADIEVGSIGKWLNPCEAIEREFGRTELAEILGTLKHSGWVSLKLSTLQPGLLLGLECGIPAWGLFGVLEGCPAGIGGFFEDLLGTRFRESWVCSQVLSTWPWPLEGMREKIQIPSPCPEAEKHFWMEERGRFRDVVSIESPGIVGVISAWGMNPEAAWARTVRTARGLRVKQGQWRGDGWRSVERTWLKLDSSFAS